MLKNINFNILIILIICSISIKNVTAIYCYSCNSGNAASCINEQTTQSVRSCTTGCYVMIGDNGETIRGCLEDITNCGENCAQCNTGDGCNYEIYPKNRLQCHQCIGDNCNGGNMVSSPCRKYVEHNENDSTCFIQVDQYGFVVRGCIDDYKWIDCSETSETCEMCSGEKCNSKIIPEMNCVSCNSITTATNCIDNVSAGGMNKICTLSLNSINCFVHNNGSVVSRGCSNSDDGEFCISQPQYCSVCNSGSYCNEYPNFKQCFQCTSDDSTFCSGSVITELVSTTICTSSNDECFTHVQNNKVTRGCLLDSPTIQEDCKDTNLCKKCDGNYCNNDQTDIYCIQCNSDDDPRCIDNVNIPEYSMKCDRSINQLRCYRWEQNGKVRRGCLNALTAVERSECEGESDKCKTCETDHCNVKIDFQECLNCDSNGSCSVSPNSEFYSRTMCKYYDDQCFEIIQNGYVTRGCMKEHPQLLDECSGNHLCHVCSGNNCNNKLSCIVCENCTGNIPEQYVQYCNGNPSTEQCYRLEETNGSVRRGCLSTLNENQRLECKTQSDRCKTCNTDNCNEKTEFQSCHKCSSDIDPNCVDNTDIIEIQECQYYMDTCKIIIDVNGQTHRGCSSDLNDLPCTDNNLCDTCQQNNCNFGIFPTGRRRCHHCSDEACKSVNNSTVKVCHRFQAEDECYTYVDDTMVTHRGCMSDQSETVENCTEMGDSCIKCPEHGNNEEASEPVCNHLISIVEPQLKCIQCSADDVKCAWGHQKNTKIQCEKLVAIPNIEYCYTKTNTDGKVQRGCLLDDSMVPCSENDNCDKCQESACNYRNVEIESCIQCNSKTVGEQSCADNVTVNDFVEKCIITVMEYDQRGCYKWNKGNGVIERGCAVNLQVKDLENCKLDSFENCEFCDENKNCNFGAAPNMARILNTSIIILLSSIIFKEIF